MGAGCGQLLWVGFCGEATRKFIILGGSEFSDKPVDFEVQFPRMGVLTERPGNIVDPKHCLM